LNIIFDLNGILYQCEVQSQLQKVLKSNIPRLNVFSLALFALLGPKVVCTYFCLREFSTKVFDVLVIVLLFGTHCNLLFRKPQAFFLDNKVGQL